MILFNSLSSNYSWRFAWRFLWTRRQQKTAYQLAEHLSEFYGGRAWLYYRGRSALHEAVRLCKTDFVLVNALTCYAVEQAVCHNGSRVVFADIDEKSFHFSLKQLKKRHKQYPKIGAVVIQNTLGVPAEAAAIAKYCRQNKIYIIEDLAHCPQGQYADGTAFGRLGDLVVLSFGRNKPLDVVNGGALIVRHQTLAGEVVAPKPVRGYWQQRFNDRIYPLLIKMIVAFYNRFLLAGKLVHYLARQTPLMSTSGEGPLLGNCSLPSYRSPFILEAWGLWQQQCSHRHRLAQIYEEILFASQPVYSEGDLLRFPVVLHSRRLRHLFLQEARKKGFYLEDIWYDSPVYPVKFTEMSTYEASTCPNKEKIYPFLLNLPLHTKVTPEAAASLAELLKPYMAVRLETEFSDSQWRKIRRQIQIKDYNFLTSSAEVAAYRLMGQMVYQIVFYVDQQPAVLVVATVVNARRARFLKVAGSPLLDLKYLDRHQIIFLYLKQLAKRHKCAFIRLQPCWPIGLQSQKILTDHKFRPASKNLYAPHTLKIDLGNQTADQFWSSTAFRKSRSLIRRARREGIIVRQVAPRQGLETFLRLLQLTCQRQNFVPNEFSWIRAQCETYGRMKALKFYEGVAPSSKSVKERVVSSVFLLLDDCEMVYLYGAASEEGLRQKATYLVQWQIIKDACAEGYRIYNLWGAAPPDADSSHHFMGLTTFKKNLGGQYVSYLSSYDYVLKPLRYALVKYWEKHEEQRR